MGSVLGLVVGAVIMLVVSRNYAYLMNCYPEAGGAYSFCREVFGYDHGFLAAWFLALTYFAMLWANATSLPLFARYFLGGVFHFGRLYQIFGYEVYLGEALLSMAFLLLAALLCAKSRTLSFRLMVGMVFLFTVGIVICFAFAAARREVSYSPVFVPDKNALSQVVKIAVISPWAFIGFESISHTTEEFSFPQNRIFRVLAVSVISATVLYVFVMLLSVTAYPAAYGSWLEYIRDLDNLSGIEALPAFYAANRYLGGAGIGILMASLLALILTSLIGNLTALSRLFYALGKDGILPASIGTLNARGIPEKGVWLAAGVSVLVPLLGRTAIGWIVDVTTLGATLIYGFVSGAAWKTAGFRNDRTEKVTGLAGLAMMIAFGVYLLVPNLFTTGSMEPESYFLFVVWSVLGFFFFRGILKRDRKKRFGKTILVWIALLSLILFVSLVWMNQSILNATNAAMHTIEAVYTESGISEVQSGLITRQMAAIRTVSARSISVVVLLFAMSLGVLVQNYRLMSQKAAHSDRELKQVRDLAGKDALTGVKSKLAYVEMEKDLDEELASGGPKEPFALAVLDVNGLKRINDSLGHQAGDEHIRRASALICAAFSHSPVYRTGGDEFVVLLQGTDYENRAAILQRFRLESEARIASGGVVVASGCTDRRPGDLRLGDLFERADAEMYENKKHLKQLGAATRSS